MILVASRAAKVATAWALLAVLSQIQASSNADRGDSTDSIATLTTVVGDSIPLARHVVYVDFWAP